MTSSHSSEHEADRVTVRTGAPRDDVYPLDSGLAGAMLQMRANHGVPAGLQGGAE
ncbi:hypothetical protein [Burkholderia ambifaria]|uniref:hypothetical protein n=1 Tax=Burkholderia ambifaria TaxID=152480 RepID=UPI0012FD4664|nr:hypothetical protein [Burkholderia ambifaria]